MGPFKLPEGAKYLTAVSAVVRHRGQWSGPSLSLSGPPAALEAAYRDATAILGVAGQALPPVGKAEPKRRLRRAQPDTRHDRDAEAAFKEGAKWQQWQHAPPVWPAMCYMGGPQAFAAAMPQACAAAAPQAPEAVPVVPKAVPSLGPAAAPRPSRPLQDTKFQRT